MTKSPWQIWIAFSLCLIIVVLAMTWLSFEAVQVDRAREQDRIETELARREAELLERISSAMYRMDWMLSPLVAQEAARPHYFYKSFYRESSPALNPDGSQDLAPRIQASPLLYQPSEFVILHFEIDSQGRFSSPQIPSEDVVTQAMSMFEITETSIEEKREQLYLAKQNFDYANLVLECPATKLPSVPVPNFNSKDSTSKQSVYAAPFVQDFAEQQVEQQMQQETSPQQLADNNILMQQKTRVQNRGSTEFLERRNSTENVGLNQLWMNNGFRNNPSKSGIDISSTVSEGVMRPIWVKENLLLARRVEDRGETLIQCCWLDWNRIQTELKARVEDLLSDVEFQRVENEFDLNPAVALATLPVQLIVDNQGMLANLAFDSKTSLTQQPISGLRITLWLAWCGLGAAALAIAILLHGVIRLSERRASFVSAVTHELRTPLTTFRMYAEMLAEKMVPVEKQQQYAQTLKVQADRLAHLVENVLQFAKLERGPGNETMEATRVDELMNRMSLRLEERAAEASMHFALSVEPSVSEKTIRTRPAMVEQILFNLVDNACKYAKPSDDNRVIISCEPAGRNLRISVRDFGPGVADQVRAKMFQPFCKSDQDAANSAPGVGLGLALCRRMVQSLGGQLRYSAHQRDGDGGGAEFLVEFPFA